MSRSKPRNGKNRWRAFVEGQPFGKWQTTPEEADKDLVELRKKNPEGWYKIQRKYFSDQKLHELLNSGIPHHA